MEEKILLNQHDLLTIVKYGFTEYGSYFVISKNITKEQISSFLERQKETPKTENKTEKNR